MLPVTGTTYTELPIIQLLLAMILNHVSFVCGAVQRKTLDSSVPSKDPSFINQNSLLFYCRDKEESISY